MDTIAFVSNNTLLICSGYQVIKSLRSAKEPGKIFRSQRKARIVLFLESPSNVGHKGV